MNVQTLSDLFAWQTRRMYAMEHELVEATATLADDISVEALDDLRVSETRDQLHELVEDHVETTEKHVDRLEDVLDRLDRLPERAESPIVDGVVAETEQFNNVVLNDELRPVFYYATATQLEMLEVGGYERTLELAEPIDDLPDEVVRPIEQNLAEDRDHLAELAELGGEEEMQALLEAVAASPGRQ